MLSIPGQTMLPQAQEAAQVGLGQVFVSEVIGTAVLILLGCGVVANVVLPKTKGHDGGWLLISFGWGLGVFAGVYMAWASGAHINPAVTLGMLVSGASEYAPGVAVTPASTAVYFIATTLGAFLGAVLVWLAHKKHYEAADDPASILGTFATSAEIRSPWWNVVDLRAGRGDPRVRRDPLAARSPGRGHARRRHRGEPRRAHRLRHQPRP